MRSKYGKIVNIIFICWMIQGNLLFTEVTNVEIILNKDLVSEVPKKPSTRWTGSGTRPEHWSCLLFSVSCSMFFFFKLSSISRWEALNCRLYVICVIIFRFSPSSVLPIFCTVSIAVFALLVSGTDYFWFQSFWSFHPVHLCLRSFVSFLTCSVAY